MRVLFGACLLAAWMTASAGAQQIIINGGGCGGWAYPPACSYPVVYPIWYPAGYAVSPAYVTWGTISQSRYDYTPAFGRTIRLGESSEAFWERHGGADDQESAGLGIPLMGVVPTVDRVTPLTSGDPETRIGHLGLAVDRIEATGSSVVYHLSDGRIVTAEEGVILEIASR